jgi:putative lipoprotein
MHIRLLPFASAALLLACSPAEDPADRQPPAAPAAAAEVAQATYTCEGLRFDVTYEGSAAALVRWPGETLRLSRTPAATGVRWSDGPNTLWTEGHEAVLTFGGTAHQCRLVDESDPWRAAEARGVTFRAIGQEPGWLLEVAVDSILYLGDYGETRIVVPRLDAEEDAAGRMRLRGRRDGHTLRVTIQEGVCEDAMSGERFPYAVTVLADGVVVEGCGRGRL